MKIVILGGPGSGKKTQTGLLADHYQLRVLTVSELVKQALADESEHGLQLQHPHQTGQPVGDDILLSLLQQRLSQPDLGEGFILDGFPRNLLQALTLDELLNELGLSLDCILLFEIETDALMERLVGRRTCRSCGAVYNVYTQPTAVEDVCDLCGGRLHQRADDTEETVSSRLHVFDHLTGPLLSHYGKQGKVLRVDGEGEVAEVFARTCRMLDRFLVDQASRQVVAEPSMDPYTPTEAVPDQTLPRQTNGSATVLNGLEADLALADEKETPSTKNPDTAKRSLATTAKGSAPVKSSAVGKERVNKTTKPSVKKKAKKRPLAAKATAKKAAKKKTTAKKSTTGKGKSGSAIKPRIVKQAAKKSLTKKKTTRKPVAKQAASKAGVKKTSAGKPKAAKKQAVGKSKTTKKAVKKPIVGKPKTNKKTAKKPVRKQLAAKPKTIKKAAKKATVGKSQRAKQAVKKSAKPKAAKKVNKKKVAGKPKTTKKAVTKPAAKKRRAKGSSARR